jgi:hypothetical protein
VRPDPEVGKVVAAPDGPLSPTPPGPAISGRTRPPTPTSPTPATGPRVGRRCIRPCRRRILAPIPETLTAAGILLAYRFFGMVK